MEYNDEKLLGVDEYAVMAQEYMAALKRRGFVFVQLDDVASDMVVDATLTDDIFDCLGKIRSCLLFLGGFLGTGKLFQAGERHIESLKILLDCDAQLPSHRIRGDKTKCFLGLLSLESKLISLLLNLSKDCPFAKQIERIIYERLSICHEIFKINGLIFPSFKS